MTLAAQVAATATPSRIDPPADPSPPAEPRLPVFDIVEEWGLQSFPASDPPANW